VKFLLYGEVIKIKNQLLVIAFVRPDMLVSDRVPTMCKENLKMVLTFSHLSHVHEIGDGVFVDGRVVAVVLHDEVLERLPEVYLFGLLQAQWDHWHHAFFAVTIKK
jgi:hypothetical protein